MEAVKQRLPSPDFGPVINAVVDTATQAVDATLHPGTVANIVGSGLKLDGNSPTVGIAISDGGGDTLNVPRASVAINHPKSLMFVVPNLANGVYTIKVTTQYLNGYTSNTPNTSKDSAELTVGTVAKLDELPASPAVESAVKPGEPPAKPALESTAKPGESPADPAVKST